MMAEPRPADARFPEDGKLDRAMEDIYAQLGALDADAVQAMIDAAIDDIDITATGESFTDRGDPATADFDQDDLTWDGSWHDLDLSGIIDVGTTVVLLRVYYYTDTDKGELLFRTNGNTNEKNVVRVQTLHTALTGQDRTAAEDVLVAPDADGVIEYNRTGDLSSTDTTLQLTVGGWWS